MTAFEHSLPMILYRALDAVLPAYRELFSRHGLTEQQWRVLRVLWACERATARDLSLQTLISAPSLVSILDRMEAKGLVSRVRSTEDRRRVYVVATAKGRVLEEKIMPDVNRIHASIRERVSSTEWAAMEAILEKIVTFDPAETRAVRATA